jgi:adenylate kinase family enzyme
MNKFHHKRIVVIGTTSSGKSTLAKQVAEKLHLDFIELDALHWEANWKEADQEVFRERVQTAIRSERWVSAGNYSVVRDLLWNQAEVLIWLDYSFHIVLWRLLNRTIRRIATQEELWNGNRERLSSQIKFWSNDSLINWLLKTYWRRKREMPVLLSHYKHLKVIHFKHPKDAKDWLGNLSN